MESMRREAQQRSMQIDNLTATHHKAKTGEDEARRQCKDMQRELQTLSTSVEQLKSQAAKAQADVQVSWKKVKVGVFAKQSTGTLLD